MAGRRSPSTSPSPPRKITLRNFSMASSAIYQSPPVGSTGSFPWLKKSSLQLENYQQTKLHYQFYSSELQKKMLENAKSSIPIVEGTSALSNGEKTNYFAEHKLQKPVDKISDVGISTLASEGNAEKEINQSYLKDLSNPEVSSSQLSIQSSQSLNLNVKNTVPKPVNFKSKVSNQSSQSLNLNHRKIAPKPVHCLVAIQPIQSVCLNVETIALKSVNFNSTVSNSIKTKPVAKPPVAKPPVTKPPVAKPMKDAKCFLCNKYVKENRFEEHLFFGAVRCSQCHEEILNCRRFQLLLINNNMGIASCKHSLEYCSDPFDYISAQLSGDSAGTTSGSLFPSYVLKKLAYYIESLDAIQNKDPWRTAILQCKTLLPSAVTKSTENKKLYNSITSIVKPKPVTTQVQDSSSDNNKGKIYTMGKDTLPPTWSIPGEGSGSSSAPQAWPEAKLEIGTDQASTKAFKTRKDVCSPLKQIGYKKQLPQDDIGDLLLSQNYDLEQLEQTVEYVEVAGQCKSTHSNTKKPRPYKKRKGTKSELSPLVIGKDVAEEETEFIETPANGHYYVVREAIEECPMCYTVLCPSEFTVNVITFLMTTVCSGCSLTIYIVVESPDGVSIVTEDNSVKAPVPSSSIENKKRKYTKRAKHVKNWRAKQFFAK
ncbi:uncharacterized protein [Procambarus clarkii]|uniref:uncharacterized protein isoform X1 n=2 Tax=Procambarus clarkii TaxID=6728 RepID=UPI003743E5A6